MPSAQPASRPDGDNWRKPTMRRVRLRRQLSRVGLASFVLVALVATGILTWYLMFFSTLWEGANRPFVDTTSPKWHLGAYAFIGLLLSCLVIVPLVHYGRISVTGKWRTRLSALSLACGIGGMCASLPQAFFTFAFDASYFAVICGLIVNRQPKDPVCVLPKSGLATSGIAVGLIGCALSILSISVWLLGTKPGSPTPFY